MLKLQNIASGSKYTRWLLSSLGVGTNETTEHISHNIELVPLYSKYRMWLNWFVQITKTPHLITIEN